MRPQTPQVLHHRRETQKLPCQPIHREGPCLLQSFLVFVTADHAIQKRGAKELQEAADHYYKQSPHHIPDPAVEQKNRKSEMKIRERKGHNS